MRQLVLTVDRLAHAARRVHLVPADADRLKDWIEAQSPDASESELQTLTGMMLERREQWLS